MLEEKILTIFFEYFECRLSIAWSNSMGSVMVVLSSFGQKEEDYKAKLWSQQQTLGKYYIFYVQTYFIEYAINIMPLFSARWSKLINGMTWDKSAYRLKGKVCIMRKTLWPGQYLLHRDSHITWAVADY